MEMEQMRQELRALEGKFNEIKNMLKEVHAAITGNPLTKDGGIIARLSSAEEELNRLEANFIKAERGFEKRMIDFEKNQMKYNFRTGMMWAFGGAVVMAIFMYVLNLILMHSLKTPVIIK